jgi:hypothetical protein
MDKNLKLAIDKLFDSLTTEGNTTGTPWLLR